MDDLLNPYASPQIPADYDAELEQRPIRGNFVMDEVTQRDCARGYRVRHAIWLASSVIALPAILLSVLMFLPPLHTDFSAKAVSVAFLVGGLASIAIHSSLDWYFFRQNLRQLQAHPILGAIGPWQIYLDDQVFSIATSRGQQAWPLAQMRRMELNQRPIVLWLERDLAVALPKHGDYDEHDYAAVRRVLQKRITYVGSLLVKP